MVVGKMGVIIRLSQDVFKQGSKVSAIPVYPMFLNELESINSTRMEVVNV